MAPLPTPGSDALSGASSQFLRHSAASPIRWLPWSDAAFELARSTDRPVFLSIGFESCHWSRAMRREAFADPAIAELLNEEMVPILVDRGEHPEVDERFLAAALLLQGHGGWPSNCFLTGAGEPFFATSYLPARGDGKKAGFLELCQEVVRLWTTDRPGLLERGKDATQRLRSQAALPPPAPLPATARQEAVKQLAAAFDAPHGGFGTAPKFPSWAPLRFLLSEAQRSDSREALTMATRTLDALADRGLRDHLRGGFARYSRDAAWRVPHFEKLLADNAQAILVFVDAYRTTGKRTYLDTAIATGDFLVETLRTGSGAFAAGTAADCGQDEGAHFLWTREELEATLLPEDFRFFREFLALDGAPPFSGRWVLQRGKSAPEIALSLEVSEAAVEEAWERGLAALRAARASTLLPERDELVVLAWNGLALSGLAHLAHASGEERFLRAAQDCATYLLGEAEEAEKLRRCGPAAGDEIAGHLEDYALCAEGLLDWYGTSGDDQSLQTAWRLVQTARARFATADHSALRSYLDTTPGAPLLREGFDAALPNANAVMARLLLRLGTLAADPATTAAALPLFSAHGASVARAPMAFCSLLHATMAFPADSIPLPVLPGRATAEATAALAARSTVATAYGPLGRTGLTVSRMGVGAHRLDNGLEGHRRAMEGALRTGLNLIDCTPAGADGHGELLVGELIWRAVNDAVVEREQLIVATRAGILAPRDLAALPPELAELAATSDDAEAGRPQVTLEPRLLRALWHRSQERLRVQCIDLALLPAPSLLGAPRASLREAYVEAFRTMEELADEGHLQWYGIAWPDAPPTLAEWTELMSWARSVRPEPRLAAAGFPVNPVEPSAAIPGATEREPLTVRLELDGVAVLAIRPLTAHGKQRTHRLTDPPLLPEEEVAPLLNHLEKLETEFANRIAPLLPTAPGSAPATALFAWAPSLRRLLPRVASLQQWNELERQVLGPQLARTVGQVDAAAPAPVRPGWEGWKGAYLPVFQRCVEAIRAAAAARSREFATQLHAALDQELPKARHMATLAQKVLWVTRSVPGVSTVLVGLRHETYLREAITVLSWPPHADAARALGELDGWRATLHDR